MKFGNFEIETFVEHKFKLDGGSMFGVIPRTMWQKLVKPDENNLIEMAINLFVLKAHGKNFIFDIGLGDTLTDREKKIYGTVGESTMSEGLRSVGLTEDDIDYVIMTHLHTDHAGGAVKLENDKFVPRFKNATYVVSQKEFDDATHPNERTSAVYVPERYYALKDTGQLQLIDGNYEFMPGINFVHTGGHTAGHFGIEMESDGQKVFYYADIFMSSLHMAVPFIPATDLFPLDSMEIKRKKLPEIIEDNVIMAFDHDMDIPFARVKADGKRLKIEKVDG